MMDWDSFSAASRILSSISFAVFALVLMTFISGSQFKLLAHALMLLAFITSGIILFNSVLFKLPGWPAFMVAVFMFILSFGIAAVTKKRRNESNRG
jgi:hypothetical protein